ncbi:response regulator transcription factor [Aeromonas veronii]|uniref:response regulator transcription factor n=1 Tax=Aeromonas veronii TaxID=654 RepID=UPI000954F87B|nr:response regulator transcription factor [Aeromonas veronii]MBA2082796.1 DNA-binding response regulator [Aeromonas veronii]MCF5718876.1 response regulator transcription factor [Aeromonas veronii]MCX0421386.1 response regulator transcription factor [Aeromonas veronii]RRA92630.1 DNA-binding response regulator [Aeromonas veronii bv. sobria]TNI75556.1 DNA-binding response regulator [Aeromonas veronii]
MSFKIILADDHPLILTGIRSLIDQITPHCEVIAEAYQVSDLLKLLQQHHCDLLITDFSMPGDIRCDGMVMIQQLRRDYPTLPIIVLTQLQNSGLLQSLIQEGVKGLILKKSVINELADAIRQILLGHHYIGPTVQMLLANAGITDPDSINPLTPKESEVVRLLATGMSVTQVADYLHRSVKTISTQKKSAMTRLGLQSDSELFQYAKEHGFY